MASSSGNSAIGHDRWIRFRYQLALSSFIRPTVLLRNARHLLMISPRYWPRVLLIAATGLLALPLRWAELLAYGRRIATTPITEPPIFIIGHWRSGTTHLHNLFSQDPALGWVSMYQALAPDCSLICGTWLKRLLGRVLPQQRPMDSMVWSIELPQEDEIPLGKTCASSFYSQFMFPRRARDIFVRHVLLRNASPRMRRRLRAHYRRVLQVATLHARERRLVLKNPVNTARIRMLLDLFPDAKFIHIHRAPFDVFASTCNMHRRIVAFSGLQTLEDEELKETVLTLYEGMMRQFLEDRSAIPLGNFAELRFDDLERDAMGEMRRLYTALSLPGFEAAEPAMRRYVAAQVGYRKNNFTLSDAERTAIAARWGFAFPAFGYSVALAEAQSEKESVVLTG